MIYLELYGKNLNLKDTLVSRESGLVKLEEKHGVYLFKFSTLNELYSICLKIVNARYESGEWNYPEKPEMLESFDYLPERTLVTLPKNMYDLYKSNIAEHREKVREYKLLIEALSDGRKALDFLKYRSSYEYENFEIIDLDNINTYEG